jgi:hypothetical protein
MITTNTMFSYAGLIALKSADKKILIELETELLKSFKISSKPRSVLKNWSVLSRTQNSYIGLFRSPFVYKKAKESFLFKSFSKRIKFNNINFFVLKQVLMKLKNFKGKVNSSITFKTVKQLSSTKSQINSLNFADKRFKSLISL